MNAVLGLRQLEAAIDLVLFQALGIERHTRNAKVVMASVSWNYTTFLNIAFLLLAAALVWRYFRRGGGWAMLRMMNKPIGEEHHAHAGAHVCPAPPCRTHNKARRSTWRKRPGSSRSSGDAGPRP